jgi:MFS family permease
MWFSATWIDKQISGWRECIADNTVEAQVYNVGVAMTEPNTRMPSARLGLAILAFINLLSYLDRYIVSALTQSLKEAGLGLTDANLGSLMSGFLVVYTLTAPLFGTLGDRRSRPRLIALGVAIWSIATALSGLAVSYVTLLLARASVGIGEAAYVTIAPSLLSDYFPVRQRGRVMAIFFCAIPVGSALGYIVGGLVDKSFGWRAAFYVAGLPGLALAALCLTLHDPPRGIQDGETPPRPAPITRRSMFATYATLIRNPAYRLTILGYAAYTFAVGGLAFWMPAFLERVHGMPRTQATVSFGAIVVVTGFVGTFIGGWLGDSMARRSQQAYLWLCGVSLLAATPFVWFALSTHSNTVYIACMVIAQLLLFLSTGPINAAIINLVLADQRATAIALGTFAIHALGDVLSPPLIGWLSDLASLERAVEIVPLAVFIGGLVWLWAARVQGRQAPLNRTSPGIAPA